METHEKPPVGTDKYEISDDSYELQNPDSIQESGN